MSAAVLTRKKSLTFPQNLLAEAEQRSGPRGLSAYVADALASKLEMDRLQDYLDETERLHGPISPETLNAATMALATAYAEIEEVR